MKKYLVTFLLLLTVVLGLFITLQLITADTADQVVYTEETLSGDVSHAEGIELFLQLHCDRHLFWDVNLTTGQRPATETDFTFLYEEPRQKSEIPPRFSLGLGFNGFHASGSGDILENHGTFQGQYDMIKAVADRTPAGESRTEIVKLQDYYEYYPLYVDIVLGDLNHNDMRVYHYSQTKYAEEIETLFAVLEKTFSFPVLESDLQEITIEKRQDGSVASVRSNPSDKSTRGYLESTSVVASDAVYFTAIPRQENGTLAPYEGSYGLYTLPYELLPYDAPYPGAVDTYTKVHPEKLELVLPFRYEEEIVELSLSPDEKDLFLTLRRTTDTVKEIELLVLDRQSLCEKERVLLYRGNGEGSVSVLNESADYRIYLVDYRILVALDRRSGQWERTLTVSDPTVREFWLENRYGKLHYELSTAYDGERIVVAAYSNENGWNDYSYSASTLCSVYLSVYSEKGNLYTGKFTASLDTGTDIGYNSICKPVDGTSPVLTLP